MMRRSAWALLVFSLFGCVPQPQTSAEFRKAVAAGTLMTTVHSATVQRPFRDVVSNLRAHALPCLDRQTRSTTVGSRPGDMSTTITRYNPKLELLGAELAELTLQAEYSPRPIGAKIPEGGLFLMVTTIESKRGRETELTFYGRKGGDDAKLADTIPAWASGTPAKCPLE